MSKNTSEPAPIKQRFIACVQSTGRVGKSMVADGILSWLSFAGIPHSAIDTDVQHHTLSDRYKMHLLDATSSEDEFEQLLENLPESPTLIVDFPGNKTSKILEFAAHFQMLKAFRASGIRPTLLIFTADDSTAKDSALETLDVFGDDADYLLRQDRPAPMTATIKKLHQGLDNVDFIGAQQRYVKSHRNLFRSPRSEPRPGRPYRPIRVTGVGRPPGSPCFCVRKSAGSERRRGLWSSGR